jgi:hypothetical protein
LRIHESLKHGATNEQTSLLDAIDTNSSLSLIGLADLPLKLFPTNIDYAYPHGIYPQIPPLVPRTTIIDARGRRFVPTNPVNMSSSPQALRICPPKPLPKLREVTSFNIEVAASPQTTPVVSEVNEPATTPNGMPQSTDQAVLPKRQNSLKRRRIEDSMELDNDNGKKSEDNVHTAKEEKVDKEMLKLDDDATVAHRMWVHFSKREDALDDARRLWPNRMRGVQAEEKTFQVRQKSLKRREANILALTKELNEKEAQMATAEKELKARQSEIREIEVQFMKNRQQLSNWKNKFLQWSQKDEDAYYKYLGKGVGSKSASMLSTPGHEDSFDINFPDLAFSTMGDLNANPMQLLSHLYTKDHTVGLPGPSNIPQPMFPEATEQQILEELEEPEESKKTDETVAQSTAVESLSRFLKAIKAYANFQAQWSLPGSQTYAKELVASVETLVTTLLEVCPGFGSLPADVYEGIENFSHGLKAALVKNKITLENSKKETKGAKEKISPLLEAATGNHHDANTASQKTGSVKVRFSARVHIRTQQL